MKPAETKARLVSIYQRLYAFYGPQHWWPADTRLEVIVGAVLTQNTSWVNVEKAINNLKSSNKLSSISSLRSLGRRRLAALIRPAGYYNIKAARLANLLEYLDSEYGQDLALIERRKTADIRKGLLSVNGVGPETADSIMLYAFGRPVFVVDTYTKRVFSRHGFFNEDKDYDLVQKLFMDNLPRSSRLYNEYHALIVRLAKDTCKMQRRCNDCALKLLEKSTQ